MNLTSPVAEQSVSGLLSQKGNGFHEKQVSFHSNQSRGTFLFGLSTGTRVSSRMQKTKCEQVTAEMWVIFPTSHDA